MLEKDKVKTAEEFNAELYEKVSAEFEEYKNNLLAMSPEQILEHAYDYAIREDIVLAFAEENKSFVLEPFELNGIKAENGMYTFWPNIDNTDGFFAAKLRRIK